MNKNLKNIGTKLLCALLLTGLSAKAFGDRLCKSQVSNKKISKAECMERAARRMTLLNIIEKNYDPQMMRMLKVNIYTVKALEGIKHLENASAIKKEVLRQATLFADKLETEMASVRSEELPEYILGIIGDVIEHGVKETADLASSLPAKASPGSLALQTLLSAAPGVIDITKKVFAEFPKIAVASLADAEFNEKSKEDFLEIYVELEEARRKGEFDDVQWDVINQSFATFMGQTLAITEGKIDLDSEAQQFLAMGELLDYQNGELSLLAKEVQEAIMKQTADLAEQSKKNIQKKFKKLVTKAKFIESQNKAAHKDVKEASQVVARLEKGQAHLKDGQVQIIDGVDYLTRSQMERDIQSEITSLTADQLRSYVDDKTEVLKKAGGIAAACGASSQTNSDTGQLHFTPSSVESKGCLMRLGNLENAKDVLGVKDYNQQMGLANDTVNVIGNLGALFKDPNMQKFANDAGKVIDTFSKVSKAVETFSKMGEAVSLISNMAGLMSGVGTLSAAMNLLGGADGDGQAAVNKQILEKLKEIQASIEDMHTEMNEQFKLTQKMITDLGEEVSIGMQVQSTLLTDAIAFQGEQNQKNHKQIMEELGALRLVNVNIASLFKNDTLQGLTKIFKKYHSSLASESLVNLLSDSVIDYTNAVQEVLPDAQKAFPFYNQTIVESSLLDLKELVELTTLNKTSVNGKYVLLSLLSKINSSTAQLPGYCDDSFTQNLLFANVINQEFSGVLKSRFFDENSESWRKRSRFYVESENIVDKGTQVQYLSNALLALEKLGSQAQDCLGLREEDSDSINGPKLFQNLATYYYDTLRNHLQDVRDKISSAQSHVRSTLLNEMKAGTSSLQIGSLDIFNGMVGALRGNISDEFVYNAKAVSDLSDKAFAHTNFMAKPPAKSIGRCMTSGQYQPEIKTLEFPSSTVDTIISDPSLKLAMSSGLVVWDWCFEIGPYDGAKGHKPVFLKATQSLGDQELVRGVWGIQVPIPAEFVGRTESADTKTTVTTVNSFGIYRRKPGSKTVVENSGDCVHSDNTTKKSSWEPAFVVGELMIENPGGQMEPELVESGTITRVRVTCQSNEYVFPEIWNKAAVTSASAMDYSKKLPDGCRLSEKGLFSRCHEQASSPLTLDEESYQVQVKKFWNRTEAFSLEGARASVALVSSSLGAIEIEKQVESVHSGLKNFYLTLKLASENCERSALLGLGKCRPLNNTIELGTPAMPLENLTVAGEMLVKTPLTFFRQKTASAGTRSGFTLIEDELLIRLSQVLSPASILETANIYRQTQDSKMTLGEAALKIVDENEELYRTKALPYLQENFEFDRDLLLHEEPIRVIHDFVDELKAL